MSVADELKQRRLELEPMLLEIAKGQIELQKLVTALDLVIGTFDPDYQVAPIAGPMRIARPRKSGVLSAEANAVIGGVNKRQTVLEVLREAGEPITTTDCASKFAAKLGIACEERDMAQIAHRISDVLTQSTNAGRGPAVRAVGRAQASVGGRCLALVPDPLWRLVALPVSAQVPRGRGTQNPPEDFDRVAATTHPSTVLPPGEFGNVPVETSQGEAVVDADVGALHPQEEALDLVGVRAVPRLVSLRVVDTLQLVQSGQIVVAGVLVRKHGRLP
jgi:hypothetical protein